MSGIAHDAGSRLVPVGIGLMDPESPRANFLTDGKVIFDLCIKIWIRGKKVFDRTFRIPFLFRKIPFFAGEETVVG